MTNRLQSLINLMNDPESLVHLPTKELMKGYLLQFCHGNDWKTEREEVFKMIDNNSNFT